jgi:putative membrane protein insertion efficiency factor
MNAALRGLFRAYRRFVSPMLGTSCRFYPSCSRYAEDALEVHGVWKGGWLAACRICRCGPWHPGGYDPVPTRGERAHRVV